MMFCIGPSKLPCWARGADRLRRLSGDLGKSDPLNGDDNPVPLPAGKGKSNGAECGEPEPSALLPAELRSRRFCKSEKKQNVARSEG